MSLAAFFSPSRAGMRGVTLMEILVAMFVTGIGLLALLSLFPLGLQSMRQSTNDDRARTSSQRLSEAVRQFQNQHNVLPSSFTQLTPFLQGDDRYEDGKDGGYAFVLEKDGMILAKPAVPGKTGIRHYCKPLLKALEDCTSPEDLRKEQEASRRMRENILVLSAEFSAKLLQEDLTEQAVLLVREFVARQFLENGFDLLDRNQDKQVTFSELFDFGLQNPLLAEYYSFVALEMELGAGDEDPGSMPGVEVENLAKDI